MEETFWFVWEEELRKRFMDLILSVQIASCEDVWSCQGDPQANFSVSTFHIYLCNSVFPSYMMSQKVKVIANVWGSYAPSSVSFLLTIAIKPPTN
jgi:hypothetical protein